VHARISSQRIVIYDAQASEEAWTPLLDDLKAEHVPGVTPAGKRMTMVVEEGGRIVAFIYRTAPLRDEEVVRILAKHGIPANLVAAHSV
jgi:hypothetical protein